MLNRWYIVHTYSGYEYKVKEKLEVSVANLGIQKLISQILIPTEEIILVKKNKKNIKKRKFFPSYIFIEMAITDVTYALITNTTGVTGFLGGIKPIPMTQDEVHNLINSIICTKDSKPKPAISFDKEENVRIIDGPFKHFVGIVEEINQEKGKIRVMVSIFGRPTPVELDFLQVEKV
jgi:transcriptional antiterminator NusG